MPIYPKGKGKYRVVVMMWGKRWDWVISGSSPDAKEFEARKRLELRALGPAEMRVAPRFFDFCAERYKPHAKATLAKQTFQNRSYQLATLMGFFVDARMDHIDRTHVEGFIEHRRAEGCGNTTINDDLKVLKHVFSFAVETKVPVQPLKVPALRTTAKAKRVRAWTSRDVGRLLEQVRKRAPRLFSLVLFVANTGCRKTEAIRLKWSAVDFAAGVVHIEYVERDADENVDEWQPKTGELRQVPMNATLRAELERLRDENRQRKKPERRGGASGPSAFVFTSRNGRPWRVWPQKKFDEARAASRLKGGPHMLRHTFATHFLASRPDLFLLSKILGHSHERTTILYSHLLPGAVADAAEAVNFEPKKATPKRARSGQGAA